MEKRKYESPTVMTVRVNSRSQFLAGSPNVIEPGEPDQPAGSRTSSSSWDDEE